MGLLLKLFIHEYKGKCPELLANLTESLFKDINTSKLDMNKKVVDQILKKFLQFSSWRLIKLSHLKNSS